MPTSANLRLVYLVAAAATCAGQAQEPNLEQLYQLPPQPVGPASPVGPKGPGKQLAEMVSQIGEKGFATEALYSRPQYYTDPAHYDPAHYMTEFARSAAASGQSPAHGGRTASVGGAAANAAAAVNLQQLRGAADPVGPQLRGELDWRHGHEDLEQAISALRQYLEKSQDQPMAKGDWQPFQRPPQEVVLLQQSPPQQPQLQQEPNREPSEALLQRREPLQAPPLLVQAPPLQNAALNYDPNAWEHYTRQASRPTAALLELGSSEASTASSLEFMERAFELVVAQHPAFVMVSSVVFGITLAMCCILNRSRLERGRQQLSEEPGQTAGVFFFLMFASSGFGVLWCYGLIQPYWKPLLVGGYVMLTISWFVGLICQQVSRALMDQRAAPKAEGWKVHWGEADSCEAAAAGDLPHMRRKDP